MISTSQKKDKKRYQDKKKRPLLGGPLIYHTPFLLSEPCSCWISCLSGSNRHGILVRDYIFTFWDMGLSGIYHLHKKNRHKSEQMVVRNNSVLQTSRNSLSKQVNELVCEKALNWAQSTWISVLAPCCCYALKYYIRGFRCLDIIVI